MELTLRRTELTPHYTAGQLWVNGQYFCDTLEDCDRDIDCSGTFDNGERKVPGLTAIPYGTYRVTLNVVSPRYARKSLYRSIGARMPRLVSVPHFDGILIHPGNTAADTAGCILVGHRKAPGFIGDSVATFFALYERMQNAAVHGDKITLRIIRSENTAAERQQSATRELTS